jgi:hypothetical protein
MACTTHSAAYLATSFSVQVFGRLRDDPIRAYRREASEKRQGTKSREVGRRRGSGFYGDLAATSIVGMVDWASRSGWGLLLGDGR